MTIPEYIYVIDDEEGFRKTLADILTAKGYTALEIPSGTMALDILQQKVPAVALIDLRLEDMSGLSLINKIKKQKPHTECIVLTGQSSQESAIEAVNRGAYGYILKPYDIDQLLLTIRRALEKRRAVKALEMERQLLKERVEEQTADLRKANTELAYSARLKDEFLAAMSHELRTPLNSILGLTEAMQDEVYGKINDKQRTCLSRIDESGQHLLTLINDILDLSKIKAGMFKFETKPVNIVEICSTCINMTKQAAQKKRIRMSISYDMTIEVIHADEKALRQILINLLNNSVKFTPEGGKIGLETKNDPDKEEVAFSVWDTGIGIDEKDWDKLFKPFVQLDGGLCKQYGGTGLGLSLVNRLVEMHGGRIVLESKPGEGSRFTVFIPCEPIYDATNAFLPENPEISAHNMQAEEKQSSQPTILMAEDNEDNISTFSDYLTAKGFRVEVARNGLEAIKTTRRTVPDIILMDIQMPEMDGLETIRVLKNDPDLSNIPIIALTSLAMVGDRDRCLKAGADEYISKPIRLKNLVETIQSILETSLPQE